MTKEQEKAIEVLSKGLATGDFVTTDWVETEFAVKTALNLIQTQQEGIEKKNKIINEIIQDLMACGGLEFIDIGTSNGNFKEDKQKLKQYFERKINDDK